MMTPLGQRLEIFVYGSPGPQGSKRFAGIRGGSGPHAGRGVMVESSKKVGPWREAVKWAALAVRDGAPPLDEPLVVRMIFTFARPRSHYRTGRNAHMLRADAPKRPSSVPDLSKLQRSTEDALTHAGIWRDDARVVEYARAAKVYIGEDPEALDAPGVVIVIERMAA